MSNDDDWDCHWTYDNNCTNANESYDKHNVIGSESTNSTNVKHHGRSNFQGRRSRGKFGNNFNRTYNNEATERPNRQHSQQVDDFDKNKEIIEVHQKFIGRIIGRGGAKIKELSTISQAKIQINTDDGEDIRKLTIIGSFNQIEKAKELIYNITDYQPTYGNNSSQNPQSNNNSDSVETREKINWKQLIVDQENAQKARWEGAVPMKKDFYYEDPEVSGMTNDEIKDIRIQNNNIQIDFIGEEITIPNPIRTFEQAFNHYPEILEEIKKAGFTEPSPIQKQAWPVLLKGLDMIGIAQTGTGKTLAFLLPGLIHIDNQPVPRNQRGGPNILVLSPTRELAIQIKNEVNNYKYRDIKCVCIYGGGNRREQIKVVNDGVEIIVATPGRLNDLIAANIINIQSVTYLILDEADRMLDMGFEPDIRKVLLDIRPDRQTIMTSATWPENVRRLARQYMSNPITVFVGSLDLAAVHSVKQEIRFVEEDDKRSVLFDFLDNELLPDEKVIIFVGKKIIADDISSDFALREINCQCIHGDREQIDREQALLDLKNGSCKILIATDVASRGIDIKDITYVINFDFPRHMEEYVHRVGRTGRAGRTGIAITFMTRNDWSKASNLIEILQEANQFVPDELTEMAERFDVMKEKKREREFKEKQMFSEFTIGNDGGRGSRTRGGRGFRSRGKGNHGRNSRGFDDFSFV